MHFNTLYEGLNLANLKRRKLGEFDRKLEGTHLTVFLINIGENQTIMFK